MGNQKEAVVRAEMGNQKEAVSTYSVMPYRGVQLPYRYHHFVYSRWLRSYRYGNDFIKLIDSDAYFAAYRRYILALLSSKNSVIRIAVLTDDIDVALGFSAVRGKILDYVHVGKDYRRQGIAKHLVPEGIETITHLTKVGLRLWPTKLGKVKFDPFT
jgi:GNAT superfamily N-acetyltransferase